MSFRWPADFPRVPDEEWTRQPVETLALHYDKVEHHGWYRNLDLTLVQVADFVADASLVVDYSGGTGIFTRRLLETAGARGPGVLVVDSSPKFLRRALEKLGGDVRVAFRLIRWLREERRLERLDEALSPLLLARGADALVSTNAIHLYLGLEETLRSWARALRPRGRAFVQSGNVRNPAARPGEWIIDETVDAIHHRALDLVREDPRFARWRPLADDRERLARYTELRRKFFPAVRPLEHYVAALAAAGLPVVSSSTETIAARVDEWFEFLAAYHEGVLGWLGGSERVEGRPPAEEDVHGRLALLRAATRAVFGDADGFDCCWTYLTCERAE